MNLTQFNALLKRFKVISSDGDESKQQIEDGHTPIHPDMLVGMNQKQIQKALQKQIK